MVEVLASSASKLPVATETISSAALPYALALLESLTISLKISPKIGLVNQFD